MLRLAEDLMVKDVAMSTPGQKPEVQISNCTLKWTVFETTIDASLYLADIRDGDDGPWSSTNCLRHFLDRHEQCRPVLTKILNELREKGALNPHGRNASVGQHLKTTPAALLCVGLCQNIRICCIKPPRPLPYFVLPCCNILLSLMRTSTSSSMDVGVTILALNGTQGKKVSYRTVPWSSGRQVATPPTSLLIHSGRASNGHAMRSCPTAQRLPPFLIGFLKCHSSNSSTSRG